jgi:CRP-like cAMP-binding protein
MICVKSLEAGEIFGELALINNKPRAATIMTKEDCNFAILDKKGFDRNLKHR